MSCSKQTIFITATDTDAGKTWVTASVIRALLKKGISAKALKPIACGLNEAGLNDDIEILLAAQGFNDADKINLFRYAMPAAPSQAAAAENAIVDTDKLTTWCKKEADHVDTCLIEGVGGLMVPITDNWLVSDWIEATPDAEVWLVVGCKLGAINQTLLTLEQLKQMGRSPTRIFFNAPQKVYNDWITPTRKAVEPFLNANCQVYSLNYDSEVSLN
ncbi:dethiobiotin synthase [Mariprofundus sp. EBB-1]|uniref:dethiobiotin synthase n=1 Tax=Mariprofundus sp. EBB-1 TaxID=2650971 RepID=UPI000EF252D8|nr:dethiobiotin synthase [Mariprofundus sp. EBB-1]RLL54716.1 dethiobiotin synthase [Mariprofundus sp. EBB-1]